VDASAVEGHAAPVVRAMVATSDGWHDARDRTRVTDLENPMPQAQRSVVIDRSVEDVFAFFADPANDSRWRPSIKEIAAQGPPAVGAKIHQVVSGPGGRGIPADIEVIAYEPTSRYAFRVTAGPVRPAGEYRFVSFDGGTEVTFELNAEITGLKKLLMTRSVQKSMDSEMKALDTAKRLLELG